MKPTDSTRTTLVRKFTKTLWVITLLLFAGTFWLFYQYSNGGSDENNAAGIFGILTAIIAFIFMMMATTFSIITKGSRRLDAAFNEPTHTNKSDRKTVPSDYRIR